jgi:hypothetical protein
MRIPIKIGENVLGVPYLPVDHGESINHGYVDLKSDPSKIQNIPEVTGWPKYIALLGAINSPHSPYRSLGCEKSYSDYENPEQPQLRRKLVSYTDIAFAHPPLNTSPIPFEEMMWAYAQFAQNREFAQFVIFDPELTRTHFITDGLEGFSITIWIGGFGETDDEAFTAWESVISIFTEFIQSGWAPNP